VVYHPSKTTLENVFEKAYKTFSKKSLFPENVLVLFIKPDDCPILPKPCLFRRHFVCLLEDNFKGRVFG